MEMKLFLVLAFVAAAYGAAVENCHMNRLASCGDPLSEFRKKMGKSFPTSEDQVKELCVHMEKADDCAELFKNKCATPMQLETIGFLTEGSHAAYKDFCQEGSKTRTDYLTHAECLDASSKTDEAKEHYSYIEAALEDLSEKPAVKRLATACCGYQLLHTKTQEIGKEKCGAEAVEAFNKVIEMAVSTLPNVFCSGFDPESSKCKDVMPPPGTKPKGTLKNSHIAQAFASIYLPDIKE